MVDTRSKDTKTKPKSSRTMNPVTSQNPTPTTTTTTTTTTPTPSSTNPTPSTLIQHKLLHKNSSVLKFAGNVGSTPADVEAYIESVENHLSSLNLASEDDKLTEAKLYLDYSRGDLKINCQSHEYRRIKKWSDLKSYLRNIYGQVNRKDPPVSLSKILRDLEKSEGYYRTYMANVFLKTNEFVELLAQSNWVTPDKAHISLENFQSLLYLSLGLKYLPECITNAIRDKWEPTDGFSIFIRRIEESFRNNPQADQSKLMKETTTTQIGNTSVVNLVKSNRSPTGNPQSNVNTRMSRDKKNVTCFKCKRLGHTSSECRTKPRLYCHYHKTNTHNTVDCRDKPINQNNSSHKVRNFKTGNPQNFQNRPQNSFRSNPNPRNPNPQTSYWYPNHPYPQSQHDFSLPPPIHPPHHPPSQQTYSQESRPFPQYSPQYRQAPIQNAVNQVSPIVNSMNETVDPISNFQSAQRQEGPV